jgi:hypothetical protein
MENKQNWRDIVASSLGWEQAHSTLENAVDGLPPACVGKSRPHFRTPHGSFSSTSE